MKRTLFFFVVTFSLVASAGNTEWDSELCVELFGENPNSNWNSYSDNVTMGESRTIRPEDVGEISEVDTAQLWVFFKNWGAEGDLADFVYATDEHKVTMKTFTNTNSNITYVRVQAWSSGTESSAVFVQGQTTAILTTGDGDCSQVINQ